MATAYVTEFGDWPTQLNLVMAKWSSRVVEQAPITVSGASAQSAAFASTTRYILWSCDGIHSWTIGSNPTATTSKMRFGAGEVHYIEVQSGDKIAFITNT